MLTDSYTSFPRLDAFFAELQISFFRAADAAGATRQLDFCIAERRVRLEFAGVSAIQSLTRALNHLTLPPQAEPDITLHVWDLAETGDAIPPPPWDEELYERAVNGIGVEQDNRVITYHPDGRILYVYDSARHIGYVVTFDQAQLPVYERAAPLRPILFPALADFNIQYTHGACIGLPDGGVLIAGRGGAGKSTTSLACLHSELLFAGDDYCALEHAPFAGDTPRAHSLYSSAKAGAATIARLPFLEPLVQYWDTEGSQKAICFLHEQFPEKIIKSFPLRAVLIPRVTGERDTRAERASAQAALLALAPSTVAQLPHADGRVFQRLARLMRQVPCYYFLAGTEMQQIPRTILKVLEQHGVRA